MRRLDYLLLTLLAAVWGLSFVFYRVGAPAFGPGLFVELRVALAGAALAAYAAVRPELRSHFAAIRRSWRAYAVLGALNSAIPFTLIATSELQLPASYASILNSTAPLFSVALGAAAGLAPLRRSSLAGVALGVLGVVLLVGVAPFPTTAIVLLSALCSVLAALSYALAAMFVRARLASTDPFELSLGQLALAAVWLVPLAVLEVPSARPSWAAWEAVAAITFVSTVFAYSIYFRILQSSGATSALTVTFLTPIFGVLAGAFLLGESVGWGTVVGIAAILASVRLITAPPAVKPAPQRGGSTGA